ncbi:hypothetical protein GQ85_26440 [Rhodococcus rhodochrous]|nr:hypothetical protein GQ85_26440 [Rhodococcus rhodochrous]
MTRRRAAGDGERRTAAGPVVVEPGSLVGVFPAGPQALCKVQRVGSGRVGTRRSPGNSVTNTGR